MDQNFKDKMLQSKVGHPLLDIKSGMLSEHNVSCYIQDEKIGAENKLQPEFEGVSDWTEAPYQHIVCNCSMVPISIP